MLLAVGLLVVLAGMSGVVVRWALGPIPGVTAQNAQWTRSDMHLADVERLLGGPGNLQPESGYAIYRWRREDPRLTLVVEVQFGTNGKVEEAFLQEASGAGWQALQVQPTSLGPLRRWLGF